MVGMFDKTLSGFVSQNTLSQEVGESNIKLSSVCNITKLSTIFSESSNRELSVKISEVSSMYDEEETTSVKNCEENIEAGSEEGKHEVTVKGSDTMKENSVKIIEQVQGESDAIDESSEEAPDMTKSIENNSASKISVN